MKKCVVSFVLKKILKCFLYCGMTALADHQTNDAFSMRICISANTQDQRRTGRENAMKREAGNLPNVPLQNSFKDNQLNS